MPGAVRPRDATSSSSAIPPARARRATPPSREDDAAERWASRTRPRILLAYPHKLLREGLRVLLQACGGDVAAEAGDGQEAVEKIQELSPELAVLGATLPNLDGVEVARQTQRRSPHVRVLLILDGVAEDVAGILASGAIGCLSLDADAAELRRAIQMVMRGDRFASPRFLTALPPSAPLGGQPVPPHERAPEPLSPREREVLHLAANGLRNQEIARRLSVSVKTVEAHKAHIMRKLRLRGPADLIKYAIRAGLVDLGERGHPSEAFSRGRAGFTEM